MRGGKREREERRQIERRGEGKGEDRRGTERREGN